METQSDLSKKYLSEALILLMKKKDYNKITNKDITDKAGLSHITIYRNFNSKEEILSYYLNHMFNDWKNNWDENKHFVYNIFLFFHENKSTLDLIYKAKKEHLLISIMLSYFGYNEDDNNVLAYSRVSIAYLIFGWCNEWYKRGMTETPEEMAKLFEQAKNNE